MVWSAARGGDVMSNTQELTDSTTSRLAASKWRRLVDRHRSRVNDEGGFTLVELLIVTVVTPLVVGGLAVMMLEVLKVQGSVTNRLTGSADIQTTSATFNADIQSSDKLTTNNASTPAGCSTTGTRILNLQQQGTVVTYAIVVQGTKNNLVRLKCTTSSTTVTAFARVAGDVPSNQSVTVTCPSCSGANVPSSANWIPTLGVTSVKLAVSEPNTGASFALSTAPRGWTSFYGYNYQNPFPFPPLELLGGAACNGSGGGPAILTETGSSTLNVGNGASVAQANSPCAGSVNLSGTSSINAAGLTTNDITPSASVVAGSSTVYPAATYAAPVTDPLASYLTAPGPTGASGVGSCTGSGIMTCTPGIYATSPSFSGQNVTFQPGNYTFALPVLFTSSTVATVGGGNFDFKGGLTMDRNAIATFNTGNYTFEGTTSSSNGFSVQGNASISTGTGGALFYIKSGTATIANGVTVALTGETANYGVAIWDVSAVGVTNPLTVGGGSTVNASYGGIYAPYGEVLTTNGGIFSTAFIVSSSLMLTGNATVNVG
jgi:hypothetical protein